MKWPPRAWIAVALPGGVVVAFGVLAAVAARHSLLLLAVPAALSLLLCYWRGYRFGPTCAVFATLALALAASPIDIAVRLDGHGLRARVLPASYGRSCNSADRACYGCIVPAHPVKHAVVVSF